MKFDPDIHHRQSIRLRDYDYSANGAYFVTICAHQRECLFGENVAGEMWLNDAGCVVESVWQGLPERFPSVALDAAVIMPNHVHGIICIHDVGAPLAAPELYTNDAEKGAASSAPTLGVIMRAFKSISAIAVNRLRDNSGVPVWQRNYYERIIRNDDELGRARRYIEENPMQWHLDAENPANIP